LDERNEDSSPLMWPWLTALSLVQSAAEMMATLAKPVADLDPPRSEPEWTTPNRVIFELASLRVREFRRGGGPTVLVVAPLALHHSTVADFAHGHSVIEALMQSSSRRLLVIDWKSATANRRDFGIDAYLADLNVVAEEIGVPADYVGICQGGWLALVFAARFPGKVRSLVLAGSPVDVFAAPSVLTQLVQAVPASAFEELVQQGRGRVSGGMVLRRWKALAPDEAGARVVLQIDEGRDQPGISLEARFIKWYDFTVDLPGAYYLEVVTKVYRENQIARGSFEALGKAVDLVNLTAPIFVLAGEADLLVAPEQALAVRRLAHADLRVDSMVEPCGHLSLFMGARTIAHAWPEIGRWIRQAAQ
jgi:poly(3-hydroxyalkanoate) synthetase